MAAEYWLVFSDGTINWKVRTPEFVRIERGDSVDLRAFAAEADTHEPSEAAE